jgi:hypothetical protein
MKLLTVVLSLLVASVSWGQSCSSYNTTAGTVFSGIDRTNYSTGAHGWTGSVVGHCQYTASIGNACNTLSSTTMFPATLETGQTTGLFRYHEVRSVTANGIAFGINSLDATSAGNAAVEAQSCLLPSFFGCVFNLHISADSKGFGASVGFDPNPLCKESVTGVTTGCPGETGNQCPSCCPGLTANGSGCVSPIVIDTAHVGYKFTDPEKDWVTFDMRGDGKPVKMSWPVHGSGNGFLVMVQPDGKIDTGKEMFGSFSEQMPGPQDANGWNSLARYDQYDLGGNVDRVIDAKDKVWPKLRILIDEHCYREPNTPCVSLASELHPLSEYGIHSISVHYGVMGRHHDEFGNVCKFTSLINPDPANPQEKAADSQVACDWWLKLKK